MTNKACRALRPGSNEEDLIYKDLNMVDRQIQQNYQKKNNNSKNTFNRVYPFLVIIRQWRSLSVNWSYVLTAQYEDLYMYI